MVIARLESALNAPRWNSQERANQNTAIEQRARRSPLQPPHAKSNSSLLQTAAISKHELDTVVKRNAYRRVGCVQELDNKRIAELGWRAEAVLDRRTIRSPVDGVVVDRFKAAGEYIENEPVMRVAQLDPLHVEVIVSPTIWAASSPACRHR